MEVNREGFNLIMTGSANVPFDRGALRNMSDEEFNRKMSEIEESYLVRAIEFLSGKRQQIIDGVTDTVCRIMPNDTDETIMLNTNHQKPNKFTNIYIAFSSNEEPCRIKLTVPNSRLTRTVDENAINRITFR